MGRLISHWLSVYPGRDTKIRLVKLAKERGVSFTAPDEDGLTANDWARACERKGKNAD